MVTNIYDQSSNYKKLANILQVMVAMITDKNLNNIYCFQSTNLILKMVLTGDSDDKYDYQKVPTPQNIIMTPNENDKNSGYGTPIRIMMVTLSDRDNDNSYHILFLWFLY